jgi:NAD(P)H-hydrate epimerase
MTKEQFIVTAAQMRQIEERIFAAGMPVAALMEKVAGLLAKRIQQIAPLTPPFSRGAGGDPKIGIIVGPGHNGGDALVVARELHFRGYQVSVHAPISKLKELTNNHAKYAKSLGIPFFLNISQLEKCDLLIDGLFGFGLEREISGDLATTVETINSWQKPIFSIDIPSGIHTDTGEVLGVAIRATRSFCLGLWKLAFLQDCALEYIGIPELIDFDIPLADITAILGESPHIERITRESAFATLPLPRPPATYKYRNGHLLIIAGARPYSGAAILTALGARATGVGMLTVAVPDSIKLLLNAQLPEALIVGCPETEAGAIRELPPELELGKFDAIACGPGLTAEATSVVETVLAANCPLVLDADGLNICAKLGANNWQQRPAPTVITPHLGEFKKLFPELAEESDRLEAARKAVEVSGAVLLFKGARAIVASPSNSRGETIPKIWINPESTAALARGGSGDVLTGLIGGLLAGCRRFGDGLAGPASVGEVVKTAVWWHARAAMLGAEERTELGVDAYTLTEYLMRALV